MSSYHGTEGFGGGVGASEPVMGLVPSLGDDVPIKFLFTSGTLS